MNIKKVLKTATVAGFMALGATTAFAVPSVSVYSHADVDSVGTEVTLGDEGTYKISNEAIVQDNNAVNQTLNNHLSTDDVTAVVVTIGIDACDQIDVVLDGFDAVAVAADVTLYLIDGTDLVEYGNADDVNVETNGIRFQFGDSNTTDLDDGLGNPGLESGDRFLFVIDNSSITTLLEANRSEDITARAFEYLTDDATQSTLTTVAEFQNQFEVTIEGEANGIISSADRSQFTSLDNGDLAVDAGADFDTIFVTVSNLAVVDGDDDGDDADLNYLLRAGSELGGSTPAGAVGDGDADDIGPEIEIAIKSDSDAQIVSIEGDEGIVDQLTTDDGAIFFLSAGNIYTEADGIIENDYSIETDDENDIDARSFTVSAKSIDENTDEEFDINNEIVYLNDADAGSWGLGFSEFRVPAAVHAPDAGVLSFIRVANDTDGIDYTVQATVSYGGECVAIELDDAPGCTVSTYEVADIVEAAFPGTSGDYDITVQINSDQAEVECYIISGTAFTNAKAVQQAQ